MAWRGSISRALMTAARPSSFRSTPRLRPPPVSATRFSSRHLAYPRMLGELGCAQSLIPIAGARLTSHLTVNVRAFCELSNGTFCRSCQDR
ncbi:uncharacterized protein LOC143556123 [Bidens hawaiensis]|uniref:uncharacterized protein LOC143556123 n=1 Tax=Bidens hawaiensis TaxID=980011 RepID=UPI00404A0F4F